MKNRNVLLTVAVFLGMISGLTAQNVPSYVPVNGLRGWYPFNSNANDESGNGNNGTVNGATLTIDRNGNSNSAYRFDGISNIISTVNAPFINPPFTLSAWIKVEFVGNFIEPIISLGGVQGYNTLYFSPSWSIQGSAGTPSIGTSGSNDISSINHVIPQNTWKHLIVTVTSYSTNEVTFYVDGVAYSQNTTNGFNVPFPLNNSGFNIGSHSGCTFCGTTFFNGSIDDIGLWNRALTQQEITALYQGDNTTANCLDLPSNLQQGLVGYWPFCGNANDESGNGNNGTVNGATLTTDRFGSAGKAYKFDGNQIIDLGNKPEFNFTGPFAISAWAKKNTSSNQWHILGKRNGGFDFQYQLSSNDLPYGLAFGGLGSVNSFIQTGILIPDSTWEHFVGMFNGSTWKLFRNGNLVDSLVGSLTAPVTSNLVFGNSGNTQGYVGTVDDIAIWNRALSQSEITQLYNQGICKTSITVTDTLLIHTGITSYNPVAYQNTLKVWPNPGNQDITIDAGNLALMLGWKIRVSNAQGVQIFPSGGQSGLISQQQQTLDMSNWGGNGLYFLYLIDPQNNIQDVKKIVLAP